MHDAAVGTNQQQNPVRFKYASPLIIQRKNITLKMTPWIHKGSLDNILSICLISETKLARRTSLKAREQVR